MCRYEFVCVTMMSPIDDFTHVPFRFILPALLIVSNDTWAYFWGFFVGRTPLIAISPKKTWEGFIGGAVCTLITGFLVRSEYMYAAAPWHDVHRPNERAEQQIDRLPRHGCYNCGQESMRRHVSHGYVHHPSSYSCPCSWLVSFRNMNFSSAHKL